MIKLGVNIDHVATLRNARGQQSPSPVAAAIIAEKAGADNITVHLREDRRHIRDEDVIAVQKSIQVPLNLEMALTDEMIHFAIEHRPEVVTLVPERRQELTTEGGLDVFQFSEKIFSANKLLTTLGIEVSLFIDPEQKIIQKAYELGVSSIELHTGSYAEAFGGPHAQIEIDRITRAVDFARSNEMTVHAGHGLSRANLKPLVHLIGIHSFQIGHSIVSDSIFVGLESAVGYIKSLLT